MIKELTELAFDVRKKTGDYVSDAIKKEPIVFDCAIDVDGAFISFTVLGKNATTLAEAIFRTSGVKARLALDAPEYVLGIGDKRASEKLEAFKEKIKEYGALKSIAPVLAFYTTNKKNGVEKARKAFEKEVPEKERKGNIAFRVGNKRPNESKEVLSEIAKHYENAAKDLRTGKRCSICGTADHPVIDEPHGAIKRVPAGQSSGCMLVSYNANAFESYALTGNENSSICTNCAKAYVEAMNHLLSAGHEAKNEKGKPYFNYSNRRNIGDDSAFLFWIKGQEEFDVFRIFENADAEEVKNLLNAPASGSAAATRVDDSKFYALTISGSAARIVIRDWIDQSLHSVKEHIAEWFSDIAMDEYDKNFLGLETRYPSLYWLAASCASATDSSKTLVARIGAALWQGALKGTLFPLWTLSAALTRAKREAEVTLERASLIKAILNRSMRKNNAGGKEFMAQLDKENKSALYQCGRLFAVLESAQYAALGETNAGLRDRFFSAAATTPSLAFGRILKMNQNHLSKLRKEKPGLAVDLDKQVQAICANIKEFPATATLEEQGAFALGYYHERQAQFAKAGEKKKEKSEE